MTEISQEKWYEVKKYLAEAIPYMSKLLNIKDVKFDEYSISLEAKLKYGVKVYTKLFSKGEYLICICKPSFYNLFFSDEGGKNICRYHHIYIWYSPFEDGRIVGHAEIQEGYWSFLFGDHFTRSDSGYFELPNGFVKIRGKYIYMEANRKDGARWNTDCSTW